MTKLWIQRKPIIVPNEYDSIEEQIAKIRGIEDVERFLNPTQRELHDPFLIRNIDQCADRIIAAIKNNEKILISYDPDADGLTASTIMYRFLKHYTDNVDYIYTERNDGHGIAKQMGKEWNVAKVKECDLLILIDSSTNDVEVCRKIKDLDKDIIIIDHHAIERNNPFALLVNIQHEKDQYPNKHLSGAGLVFKVIQVIDWKLGDYSKVDPFNYIDLVAVGLYADVMRVDVLENRFLIANGLKNIRNTGLREILRKQNVYYRINSSTIGFTIAPILNSVARMDNIKLAIDLLLSDDVDECRDILNEMFRMNDERKAMQQGIVERYVEKVDTSQKVLMIFDDQQSRGFNGIIAQQLVDKYKRPVMVGRIHNGVASGSFRSYNGFKFKSFLQEFGHGIEAMGHEEAGGFTISARLLDDLQKYIEENLPDIEKTVYVVYDLEIDAGEIDQHIGAIEKFNYIVGNGFPKVVLKVKNILVDEVNVIGKTKETVKIKTLNGNLEMIKFKTTPDYASDLGFYDRVDVVGQLQINEWYNFGQRKKVSVPQILLEDYRLVEV